MMNTRVDGVKQRGVLGYAPLYDQASKLVIHGAHGLSGCADMDGIIDLEGLAILNKVLDGGGDGRLLKYGHLHTAFMVLGCHRPQHHGKLDTHLLLVGGRGVDNAVNGLGCSYRMQ